jgi:hypothetical protein
MGERKKNSGRREPENKSSGRVAFDERGNPIWEWETQTGMYSTDVSTQRLRTLEAPELSIEETGKFTKSGLSIEQKLPGGGANPYDHQYVDKRTKEPRMKTLASRVADARKANAAPAPKPSRWSFLKKLFGRK